MVGIEQGLIRRGGGFHKGPRWQLGRGVWWLCCHPGWVGPSKVRGGGSGCVVGGILGLAGPLGWGRRAG